MMLHHMKEFKQIRGPAATEAHKPSKQARAQGIRHNPTKVN